MAPNWTHLIRFIAEEDGLVHLGQIDRIAVPDVGIAAFNNQPIHAKLISGSIYDGIVTEKFMKVAQVNCKNNSLASLDYNTFVYPRTAPLARLSGTDDTHQMSGP